MTSNILTEREIVTNDLLRARYFPDEDVLDYALRRESKSTWPAYIPVDPEQSFLRSNETTEQGYEHVVKGLEETSTRIMLLKDFAPYYSAFCLARRAKNVAFRIAISLAVVAFVTLLYSFLFTVQAGVTFVITYISLALSFEVGAVSVIFRYKQTRLERKLLPEMSAPIFEAYEIAKSAKYWTFMTGLALLLMSFLTLGVLQQLGHSAQTSFVVSYVCLCLAGQAGMIGIIFQRKEWNVRKRIIPMPCVVVADSNRSDAG